MRTGRQPGTKGVLPYRFPAPSPYAELRRPWSGRQNRARSDAREAPEIRESEVNPGGSLPAGQHVAASLATLGNQATRGPR